MNIFAFGLGIGTKNQKDQWLEVFYSKPLLNIDSEHAEIITSSFAPTEKKAAIEPTPEQLIAYRDACKSASLLDYAALADTLINSKAPTMVCILGEDSAPESVAEGYLKLQLLSHRLVKPHGVNLDGLFGTLINVAWTNQGAIDLNELPQRQLQARANGETLLVYCVDKFPPMTHYVVPEGVRIADTSRVRLGAHIGTGTTIMHEGFVNFNAGTEGPNMIEGRISAGVMVGKGSDLGGGCSTMGTLSGGGNIVISVGEECLLGANAGIGIPLGDRCTVESGLYITAGTKVSVYSSDGQLSKVVKARELANQSDLLFRRNSTNGQVECHTNKAVVVLNEALHENNA